MRRLNACSVVMALCFLLVSGGGLSASSDKYDLPIKEHIFKNGLRLLVLEDANDHRVVCKIFTDMGAIHEMPGEYGSAHFLEHLLFKGTETLGTTNWKREKAIIAEINKTEAALIEALNLERNALRQRGVFLDYQHKASTPQIDSLKARIAALDQQGEKYRDNGAMMKWYQGYGGTTLTATTEQEYMKFDIDLPAERVALFLRVEADRMRNSIFREFDQERMILVEQRLGDLNRATTPYYEAMNALAQTVSLVYVPEGFMTDFYQYSRQYQRELYSQYFIPNNTTLIFIGGVTLEQMVPLVERYFGWMKREPEPMRMKAIEPKPTAEKRLIWRSNQLKPRVELRFQIPGVGHPERPHFDVLAEALSEELHAALKRHKISASVNVNTRVVHTSRFGLPATINIEVMPGSADALARCEDALIAELERLKTGFFADGVLSHAKKVLRTAWYRTARDKNKLAFEIGHFEVMDSWKSLQGYLEARETTTPATLQQLIQKYFIPENRSVGVVKSKEAVR